jgi:nitrogenase subunit NifH
MNVVCMKFLEEPVNYLSCILQDELLARVTRKRETLIEHHPASAAAQNFNQLADQLTNQIASKAADRTLEQA